MSTGRPVGRPPVIAVEGVREGAIPRPPASINTKLGKDAWKRIWDKNHAQLDASQDYLVATMICEAMQDIARMRAYLAEAGDTELINNETLTVLHPYVKQCNELQSKITAWLASFGFSPADRAKLSIIKEEKKDDKFDQFRAAMNGTKK